ncbi:Endonuclease/exonuclease/phosphatase [Sporodiniella umbellata]|nr:Endonuclease/exonuclease/phosphatase [Sporodiniella umbellata]
MTFPIRLLTLNVRHDSDATQKTTFAAPPVKEEPLNPETFKGEQPWSIRKWKVLDTVLLYSPDILALQQSASHQLKDLEALLGDDYQQVNTSQGDESENEINALFYKTDSIQLESSKTFWLSETPLQAKSVGWDAEQSRTALQAVFNGKDGHKWTVFNVFLDPVGTQSREESSKWLLEKSQAIAKESGDPVFLLGDFNSTRNEPAYQILVGEGPQEETDTLWNLTELNEACASAEVNKTGEPVRTQEGHITLPTHRVMRPGRILQNLQEKPQENFKDTRYELLTRLKTKGATGTVSGPFGHRHTVTGFNNEQEPRSVDFILLLDTRNCVKVNHYAVLSNLYDDGLYLSDHRPVFAKVTL